MTNTEFLNDTLRDWAIDFVRNRIADARAAKLIASEDLIKSFEYEVIKATSAGVASVLFAFEAHGRILDMRNRSRGQAPISEIEEWIRKKGVNNFISGFKKNGKIPKSNTRLINAIAWGIRKSKKKPKRKKWYSNNREKDVSQLYDILLKGYASETLSDLKQSLK